MRMGSKVEMMVMVHDEAGNTDFVVFARILRHIVPVLGIPGNGWIRPFRL